MFDVRANVFENTLHVQYKGKIDAAEMQAANDKVFRSARSLSAGFAVITDIRELIPVPEDARLLLQENMKAVKSLGLAAEIRITTSQSSVTANQFQRTSRAIGYTATEVGSQIEAERLLDNM